MNLNNDTKRKILVRLMAANPKKIILFGSYANGMPGKDSDIDIMILKDKVVSKINEMHEARKMLIGLLMPFDILVATQEEFNFYKKEAGSVYKDIDRNGIVLYERK